MRILLAFYPIDDMGGIINHNEQLCAGLIELGHEVHTKIFLPRQDMPRNGVSGGRGTISPHTGLEFDQRRGYSFGKKDCVPYMGRAKVSAMEELKKHDLIIWQIAVPTKRKENRGNQDWVDLYYSGVQQLAVIHDGNFLNSYPWLEQVSHKIRGLICVHHCAYNSAKHIDIPSRLIPNPQELHPVDLSREAWERRNKGFLSLQTFKAWKHVPELVAAIPHTGDISSHLAGKGIDYYYLTSKDKCKWPGVWNKALDAGMVYHDVITNRQRDELLSTLTCLVDPSWSLKYSKIGGHFNRVVIDGILCGAVPVVRPLGISTNSEGQGELFKAGLNCVAIPTGATPEEYGAALTRACLMPYEEYLHIMTNAVELLPQFDRVTVAEQVANFQPTQCGELSMQVEQDSISVFYHFFGDN